MKFIVEVSGFVSTFRKSINGFDSVFRCRNLIIHAKSEQKAKEKAIDKFVDLSQQRPGNMIETCDCKVNSIEVLN